MGDSIALPGGRSIGRGQLSPCRCPGCRHCGAGCRNATFEYREWKCRNDGDSEWSAGYAIRCRVCLPPEPARKDREGAVVKTEEVALATIDMTTGRVRMTGGKIA